MNDDRTNACAAPADLDPALGEVEAAGAEPAAERRTRTGAAGRGRSRQRLEVEPEHELVGAGDAAWAEAPGAASEPRRGLEPPFASDGASGSEDEASPTAEQGVAADVSDAELEREVAALLFATAEPLSSARLSGLLGEVPRARIERALEDLGRRLATSGLPYELRAVAGGSQLFTSPDLCETVSALARVRREERVSPAALETLAVIAYRQPVSKAEIEAIRGVQAGPILRALVDRGLVRVAGRSDDPGHALLYGTTRQFLDVFGLASLDDLPRDGELLRD